MIADGRAWSAWPLPRRRRLQYRPRRPSLLVGCDTSSGGQSPSHLLEGPLTALRGDPHIDDKSEKGENHRLSLCPPPDLVEEVGVHAASDHGRR